MSASLRVSWLFVVVISSIAYAATGEALLREAISLEKELRSKTSMFERRPDFNRAIELYSRALEADDLSSSRRAVALLNRAGLYVNQGDCSLAIKDLDETLKLQPKQVGAYALRASCHQQAKSHRQSLEDFNKAIALAPADPVLLRERGAVYASLKDFDKAVRDYTASINLLKPTESSDLFVLRGDAFQAQGKHERAIEDYQQAIQIVKRNAAKLSPTSSAADIRQLRPIFTRLGDAYHALAKDRDKGK